MRTTPPIAFTDMAALLKRMLKDRKITYAELAKRLAISESAVKKLFIAQDCSFQRLGEICSVLGVALADVMMTVQETPIRSYRHTPEQERFLAANSTAFFVYWKIVYEGMTSPQLRKAYGFTEAALFKVLRQLDKHDLLRLKAGGVVSFPDMRLVLWENAGPLVEKMKEEWPRRLLKIIKGREHEAGYRLSLRYYRMRPSTLEEFRRALGDLEFEFARRASREEQLERAQTTPVAMVLAMAPRSFLETLD